MASRPLSAERARAGFSWAPWEAPAIESLSPGAAAAVQRLEDALAAAADAALEVDEAQANDNWRGWAEMLYREAVTVRLQREEFT